MEERIRKALTQRFDASIAERAFSVQTVGRKPKNTGRVIFIDKVKGNPDFLPDIGAADVGRQGLLPD